MMNPRYRKAEHVSSRGVQDELVLLDLEEGEYLVARGVDPADPAVIRRDVQEFIAALEAKSLLVREED